MSSPGTDDLPNLKKAFRRDLTAWFRKHQRELPWRTNRTPYRVWVSEIMLQQTRVDTVVPYFHRFMKQFPTVQALARADRSAVLKAWEGLGYYGRAMRLHEAARILARERKGKMPSDVEGLRAMKGVGEYTASAIASLAFGLDHAVVDGNVMRVFSRVLAMEETVNDGSTRRIVSDWAHELMPTGRAGEFNEAMMELGALICTPVNPDCRRCPIRKVCRAYRRGETGRFPVMKAKTRIPHRDVGAGVIVGPKGILMARRREDAMLGGLWEFPGGGKESGESIEDCIRRELKEELGLHTRVGPRLVTIKHAFSHFRMSLHAHWVRIVKGRPRCIGCDAYEWVATENIGSLALPVADRKVLDALLDAGSPPEF